MKRKGYVFSLAVFLVFALVFVVAVTYQKSVSVAQDSNYDKIAMMKISNLAKNAKIMAQEGASCPSIAAKLGSAVDDEFGISVTSICAGNQIELRYPRTGSPRFTYTINL